MNEITNRRETSKLRFHGYSYSASSNNKLLLLSNRYVAPSRFLDSKLDAISECLAIINPSLSLSRFKSVEKPCNGGGHLVNNLTSRLLLSYRPSLCRSFSVRYLTRGEKRRGFGNRDRGSKGWRRLFHGALIGSPFR